MREKSKNGKQRLNQWQFLLAWVGGQFGAFFGLVIGGIIIINLAALLGFTLEMLPFVVQVAITGAAVGWVSGWVQQWSIRKRYGRHIQHWRSVGAVLTGIAFAVVMPLIRFIGLNLPDMLMNPAVQSFFIVATLTPLFGAAGIGQAILLRKHVKHSWLFLLSTLVSGIMFAIPSLGAANSYFPTTFLVHTAQFGVTAFTIMWLFQMIGTQDDILEAHDGAITRLSEDDIADSDFDGYEQEQSKRRSNRLEWLLRWLRPVSPA